MPRVVRGTAWVLGLLLAGVLLRLAATDDLASPPLGSLDDLAAWADKREPVAAGVAIVRLVAEAGTWYVLAVSLLHVASSVLRSAGGHRLADALAVPALRRLVRTGLGVGLAAASSVTGAEEASPPGVATMSPVVETPVATQRGMEDPGGTAAMRPRTAAAGGVAQVAPVTSGRTTWTVAPGESLWTIAEELLADAWQRPPSDAETDPFWRALTSRNRHRLVDPDLIHPGQVLEVPAPPASPA